jgi:squalene-hopene/tetraprenyl-beta-curcumene cyclase
MLDGVRRTLLAARTAEQHWEGELSSSALSTATAVAALEAFLCAGTTRPEQRLDQLPELIQKGRGWLVAHQNEDGGWGDTVASLSNISTTALGWAALAGAPERFDGASGAAAMWLKRAAGDLSPSVLARAIRDRYGVDHTFSVPILAMLALTGRLGPAQHAWQLVPQLPFELAATPPRWFASLRLPVVSYALPALIAIGHVRHARRPTRNPFMRMLRGATRGRTLNVLRSIQPAGGGFLEATPLTAFVALSLIGTGCSDHPVVRNAIGFLVRSARADGSWPIDTNLATWLTTLSVNALSAAGSIKQWMTDTEIDGVRRWILNQQYTREHPYTHAPPGGWAWTDRPGGVPDADDTSAALIALRALDDGSPQVRTAVALGIRWLVNLQNSDGGIPTFCRGWGTLPFDRSSADLTAHAMRAWIVWWDHLSQPLQSAVQRRLPRAMEFLLRVQQGDGAWAPLWFGNQYADHEKNLTYGTSRVLLALAALPGKQTIVSGNYEPATRRAVDWLLQAQNLDGGFGGERGTPSSIEETALAIEAMCAVMEAFPFENRTSTTMPLEAIQTAVRTSSSWLVQHTDHGRQFPTAPIGFYFANLWYSEQLYPVVYSVAALGRAGRWCDELFPARGIETELHR